MKRQIRAGSGSPLLLLHGVTGSAGMWRHVVPLLAGSHDTVAMTALGHRGGRTPTGRPVRIADVVDDAERALDDLGWSTAHLAGNSMGGWVAAELARRRRARTLTLFSPAGTWVPGTVEHNGGRNRLRRIARETRAARPLLPVALRIGGLRQFALRDNAVHGKQVSRDDLVDLADDLLGCVARDDLLSTDAALDPLDPLPCPTLLAWASMDRILPLDTNGRLARDLLPGAEFVVLDDVGHVAMLDDAQLVTDTILRCTRQVPTSGSVP